MKHPLRRLFERLGWVRSEEEHMHRYAEADRLIKEGRLAAAEARARRERLAVEADSMRRRGR